MRVRDERGAYAVLFAVVAALMLIMAAIVVDLGALRVDARANQTVADVAATAGAADLDPYDPTSAHAACESAWQYFLANAPAAQGGTSPCGVFLTMPICVPGSTPPRSGTTTSGPYTITITYPVTDAHALMLARSNGTFDGNACQRIGVHVVRTRPTTFGNLIGAREGKAPASAVAKNGGSGSNAKGVSMIILDPTGCNALLAKGQAQVVVEADGGWPGLVAVDSSATETNPSSGQNDRNCSNPGWYAIDAVGTQNSKILTGSGLDPYGNPVQGAILSYALMPGQNDAQSYEEIDVTGGRLSPRPTAHARITRQPVDWRYNCALTNACPAAPSRPAYIDELRATVGTSGRPAGFKEYPADVPLAKCNLPPSNPPIALVGDWWINCSKLDVSTAFSVTGGNVVFQGTVNVGSAGTLSINAAGSVDRWVYFRNGNFEKDAQASVILDRTFVYVHQGNISFGAGNGVTRWIAPFAGPFDDLALWSESPMLHSLGGQAVLDIEGVFFTPNAYPMRFTGQGQQQQAKAQFITYRLEVTGQGVLRLSVDPDRSVKVPLTGVTLLR